ncbi:MAG: glycosyltransferase family 2 protein [Paludibacteraceae bacterium]|nr:glycosyltransferase family 2 protein [Paludibacteraceae bacterium]
MSIKLSIITINLNNRDGLCKTIKSVVSQTCKDYEYILIDGASIDGSVDIIKKYSGIQECRLKWISEPDNGVFQAMNKGIRMAEGEYLLFLNSGDFLVDDNVLQNVSANNYTADFLLGRCNISENGTVIHTTNPQDKLTFGYLYETGLAHQSTFIKREMFNKYGFYREDFKYNADIEFWYRTIILKACTTKSLDFVVSDYNLDGISTKKATSDLYLNEIKLIFDNPYLQLFIPDYDSWRKEKKDLEMLYWAKEKNIIYSMLMVLFKCAKLFCKFKNLLSH